MKTALILTGGGTKGAFEIGACSVILKKIIPDIIIGTSVGAMNGAIIFSNKNIADNLEYLKNIWFNINKIKLFAININVLYRGFKINNIYSNKNLFKLIKKNIITNNFENLYKPFYINCTNYYTGKTKFFSKGDLIKPIVASCSIPLIFPPLKINNNYYVDGELGSIFGIKKAIELKCKRIILIDLEYATNFESHDESIKDAINHVWGIVRNQNINNEIQICKDKNIKIILIRPKKIIPEIFSMNTKKEYIEELINFGEKCAKEKIKLL
jgi:NTE family protein